MNNSMISKETLQKWYIDKPHATFDDLVGMENLKTRLRYTIDGILSPLDCSLLPPKGKSFLFYGLPGTGKTLAIRAFVRELMDAGYRCLSLSAADVCSSYAGVAETMVETIFQEALDNAPCVIVLDDFDCICRDRLHPGIARHEQMLTIAVLQGLHRILNANKQVILLTASCHPHDVDEAFLDHSQNFRFNLPDEADRVALLSRVLSHVPLEDGFSCRDLAEVTENYSFRDLNRLVDGIIMHLKEALYSKYAVHDGDGNVNWEATSQACIHAMASGSLPVTRAMFEEALREYPPSDKTHFLRELENFESRFQF